MGDAILLAREVGQSKREGKEWEEASEDEQESWGRGIPFSAPACSCWESSKTLRSWGTHVHPGLIHVIVWQNPLQYCKVISFQLKLKKKKKKKTLKSEVAVCAAAKTGSPQNLTGRRGKELVQTVINGDWHAVSGSGNDEGGGDCVKLECIVSI